MPFERNVSVSAQQLYKKINGHKHQIALFHKTLFVKIGDDKSISYKIEKN